MGTEDHSRLIPFVPRVLLSWPDDVSHQRVDGSLLFVDVSGFTAMSERLARHGKLGAEEVNRVLNRVFTTLLDLALARCGDLLKFGGDALLLLFTGDGHALRAVRAGAEMRRALRTVGKVQTPAGRVDLRMSVGIHTGDLDLFVVGSRHRELMVVGPAATRAVEMEGTATANEIALSPAAAAAVPARSRGPSKGAGVLLARMPPPPPPTLEETQPQPDDVSTFIPEALRPAVGSAAGEGEHRLVTVGFVRFSGTDAMLEADGPDATAAALHELVSVVQEAAADHEVAFLATDIDADGGKLILVGGAPHSTGHDADHVLRTARAIVDRYEGLPLQVGINRGSVFAGDVGSATRRTYTIIGDAVNLAARVMAHADPGEILATAPALDRAETQFALEPVEPFHVKGKSQAVVAWRVGAIEGGRQRATSTDAPFVDRTHELEQLRSAVGHEPVVQVIGPAGIGKSRLVREAVDGGALEWIFTAADEYEAGTAYFPFRRLIRAALDIDPELDPKSAGAALRSRVGAIAADLLPWLPLLGDVANVPVGTTPEVDHLDPKFRTARTHDTVRRLLDALPERAATWIIEDAHWLDDSSRELLHALAESDRSGKWTVLVVGRVPAVHGAATIEIGPLDEAATLDLAQRLMEATPLLDAQLRQLVDQSGGNPLFLIELAAALNRPGEELPDSIEALVLARIDRLRPALRRLLRYGAVAGTVIDPRLIEAALGDVVPEARDPRAWKQLDEFLVHGSKGWRFRQSIFREVAYEGLPYRARREAHARIGHALEQMAGDGTDEIAERLLVHFLQAGDYAKAWRYGVIAGDRSRARAATLEAADAYQRALEAARHLPRVSPRRIAAVAESLGDVLWVGGRFDDADRAYGMARRSGALDAAGEARVMRKQGMLRERTGRYSQALRWFRRALRRAEASRSRKARAEDAELRVAYAGVRFRQGRYEECKQWCLDALPISEKARDHEALAHAYYLLDIVAGFLGDDDPSYADKALAIFEEIGDFVGQGNVLNNEGVKAYYAGEWDRALELYRRCEEAKAKGGDIVGVAMAKNNMAEILSDQGHGEEAERLFLDALRQWRAAGYALGEPVVLNNLGRLEARRRDHERAAELLRRAEEGFRSVGADAFVLEAKIRQAENALLSGDPTSALELSRASLSAAQPVAGTAVTASNLHRIEGLALAALERPGEALVALEAAASLAEQAGAPFEEAQAREGLAGVAAALDDTTLAAEQHRIAEKLFAGLGVVPEARAPSITTSAELAR